MADVTFQMPDGTSRTATVDDGIKSLPPEQQAALVGRMRDAAMASQKPEAPAEPPTNTIGGDLTGGLHDLGTSASQGLKVAGGIMSRNGMPSWGGSVSSAGDTVAGYTPNAPAGPAPAEQLADALKSGNYAAVPGLVGHSALRALPSTVPLLAAGAMGGPIAAGAAAGGLAVGPESYARAANNGRSEPTTADTVQALPGVAGEALGGALVPGGSKIANPIGRAAAKVASEAAGGAVMDASGQLGATVGTDKGASLDPYQVASSALTQGTIGAGRVGKDVVKAAGAKAAQATGLTAAPPANLDQAASVSRVNEAIQQAQDGSKAQFGRTLSPAEAANSVRKDVTSQFAEFGKALRDNGTLSPEDYRQTFVPFAEQVSRHNASPFTTEGGATSAYDRMQAALAHSPDVLKRLDAFAIDLDTLSSAARSNRMTGPLERAGRLAGNVAGVVGGGMAGGLPGVLTGLVGHSVPAFMGAKVGMLADRALGLQKPPVVQQAEAAAKMLQAAGRDPGRNPMENISSLLSDAQATPNPIMADAPAPLSPTEVGLKDAARNQAALVTRHGPDHPVGSTALDELAKSDPDAANRALANWNAMAPIREAKASAQRQSEADAAKAAQDAKDSEMLARTGRQAQQSNLEAALGRTARTTGAADTAANRNEDILQTAPVAPQVPDASLTAINAAMNQAQRRANAVKAAGGDNRLGAPSEAPEPPPAPTPAAPPPEAVQTPSQPPQAPNGLLPMGDYLRHVAMARYGSAITPDHISAGLDKLAARGGLTPDQYEFYKNSLGSPLMNPGGIHNGVLDAIVGHAAGAAQGSDAAASPIVAAAMARSKAAPGADQSGVRNPQAYAANLRQEATIAAALRATHSDLADAINKIQSAKSRPEREAALQEHLDSLDDPAERTRQERILRPLTKFGKK